MAGARGRLKGPALLLLLLLAGALALALGEPCGVTDDGGAAAPWVQRALLSPFSPDARPPLNYTKAFVACKSGMVGPDSCGRPNRLI